MHIFYEISVAIQVLDAQYQAQPHHLDPDLGPLFQVISIALPDRPSRCLICPPSRPAKYHQIYLKPSHSNRRLVIST